MTKDYKHMALRMGDASTSYNKKGQPDDRSIFLEKISYLFSKMSISDKDSLNALNILLLLIKEFNSDSKKNKSIQPDKHNKQSTLEQSDDRENRIKAVRYILNKIPMIRQDIQYLLDVLSLIDDEESCYSYRKNGRDIPYPWQIMKIRTILSECSFKIKKKIDGKLTEVDFDDAKDYLWSNLPDIIKTLSDMRCRNEGRDSKKYSYGIRTLPSEGDYFMSFSEVKSSDPLQ